MCPTEPLRMSGYYIHFRETGAPEVDRVLSAVACAGKAYHHTEDWNSEWDWPPNVGKTPVEWIQNAAAEAAASMVALRKRAEKTEAEAASLRMRVERAERAEALADARIQEAAAVALKLDREIAKVAQLRHALLWSITEEDPRHCAYCYRKGGNPDVNHLCPAHQAMKDTAP